jgi:membrane fusion protein, heavy metal efflux system
LEAGLTEKENKMIKKIKPGILLSLSLAIMLAACNKEETGSAKEPVSESAAAAIGLSRAALKEIGLQTETIARKPLNAWLTVTAKVLASQDNEAQVGSLVQGRVAKVFVRVGDYVEAGQELMLIEGLEIGEIKAGFLSAKANLEYQTANYERQKTLLDQNVGAQKTMNEARAEYEKARAEYDAERNRINAVGLSESEVVAGKEGNSNAQNSGMLPVKSPISGIVVERNVVIGQFIEGSSNAFKVVNLRSVWVDGQIYEKDISKVNRKTEALFTTAAYPGEAFRGTVSYLGQVIDEKTRTITIRAEFNNAQRKLKPQMFGELKIPVETGRSAIQVPAEALARIENADCVFIQKADTLFEKRPVRGGAVSDDMVEIFDGIRENEKVVVKGAFYLKSELLKSAFGEEE